MLHDSRRADPGDRPGPIAVRHFDLRTRLRRRRGATGRQANSISLPLIGAEDIVLPAFDDRLGEVARRAQAGDAAARDALYAAFAPKLARLSQLIRSPAAYRGATGVWDRDDVTQEGYLVFIELVQGWPGDVPLTPYLLSRFPWRLRDAIRRGVGRPTVPRSWIVVSVESAEEVAAGSTPLLEPSVMLDVLLDQLPPPLNAILEAHVCHGKSKAELARAMGVSRRTMVRYWSNVVRRSTAILRQLHPEWDGDS